jgi:hypothetical protein
MVETTGECKEGRDINYASSAEFVGELWLRKLAKCVV